MTSILITPFAAAITTSDTYPFTVPASFDYAVDVSVINTTTGPIAARVGVGLANASVWPEIYDKPVEGNDTLIIFSGLKLPTGYQIWARAAATGLYLRVTGVKRPA